MSKTYSKTHKIKTVNSTSASKTYGYDSNDNLTTESLTVDGLTFNTTYAYNGLDQLSSITYPRSGRVVSYSPNTLGRPTQVSGFVSSVSYWPSGQINQISYANGTSSTYGQNQRLWPSGFTTQKGATAYVNSSYGYDGAGNLITIGDTVDSSYNRTLGYDNINRLISISGPWGSGTITYSGNGNITSQVLGSSSLFYTYDGQNRLSSVSGIRSTSYTYDAYGDIVTGSGNTYAYDGVPNLTCFNCPDTANKIGYTYDGLNQRVSVAKAGVKTYEVYAANGNLLIEYAAAPLPRLVEYIYLGGKRVAQVQSSPSTTSLTATPPSPAVNQVVTLTATVGGTGPTGKVTFFDGATNIGSATLASGQAAKTVQFASPAVRSLTAQYSGDANNDPSTSSAQSVSVGASTSALSASASSVNLNQTFTLTAAVSGNSPSGTVTFMDGGTSLGTATLASGQASKNLALSTPGTHNITAQYAGDSLNMASTSAIVAVQASAVSTTSTTVSASPNPVKTGMNVTFTATVAGSSPTGTVTFSDGSTTLGTASLASGVATFTTAFAAAGSRTITASYGGNAGNATSAGTVALSVIGPIEQIMPTILQLLLDN